METELCNMCMITDAEGRVLVQHRIPKPSNPWSGCTFPGGHVEPGENVVASTIREVKEETGLTLDPAKGRVALPLSGQDWFGDVWVFRQDVDMNDIRLQEGETCEAKLVTRDELLRLREEGMFIPCSYMDELLALLFE